MNLKKSLYTVAVSCLLFSSCELNNKPVFNDADAFVAFDNLTMNAAEESGLLKVPVTMASISGVTGTVDFAINKEASTAIEGVHFTIKNASSTLSFTREAPTQYIEVNLIDNDLFTGDMTLVLNLTASSSNLGANVTCRITIVDDEHPLLMILGSYAGSLTSAFEGEDAYSAEVTIAKDAGDLSKVWISNLDPMFVSYGYVAPTYNRFYGIVNEEKTEIRIPVGQDVGYEDVKLTGFDSPDPDEGNEIASGGYIILQILDGGKTLHFENAWGVSSVSEGPYEIYKGGANLNRR